MDGEGGGGLLQLAQGPARAGQSRPGARTEAAAGAQVTVKVVSDVVEFTGSASAEAGAGLPLVGRSHRCKAIFAFLTLPVVGEVVIFAMQATPRPPPLSNPPTHPPHCRPTTPRAMPGRPRLLRPFGPTPPALSIGPAVPAPHVLSGPALPPSWPDGPSPPDAP
jgi:hypothetical protein